MICKRAVIDRIDWELEMYMEFLNLKNSYLDRKVLESSVQLLLQIRDWFDNDYFDI